MTGQEQKELAEWAAEWLGDEYTLLEIFSSIGDCEKEWIFFEAKMYAPILAHLAKRKMEELGYEWCGTAGVCKKYRYYIMDDRGKLSDVIDENEYIALWLAIREVVKG